jgi:hypothetical protein
VFIKKNRRKRSDGPTHSGGWGPTEGLRWAPMPYNGRSADGRRAWYSESMIRFDIGTDRYYTDGGRLAVFLNSLGITDGEPRDWVQDSRVEEWVKLNGIRHDPSLNT